MIEVGTAVVTRLSFALKEAQLKGKQIGEVYTSIASCIAGGLACTFARVPISKGHRNAANQYTNQ